MTFKKVFINIDPLKKNLSFRNLYVGQLVSYFGSAMTNVCVGFQVFHMTHSTLSVGLIGIYYLIPLSIFGFLGGAWADRMNRKWMILCSESALSLTSLLLVGLCFVPGLWVYMLYAIVAIQAVFTGLHRPALESYTQQLISKEDIAAVSALTGFRSTFAMIIAPSLAGVILSHFGLWLTYSLDAFSYFVSLFFLWGLPNITPALQTEKKNDFKNILDGVHFVAKKPLILGTYLMDILAMLCIYPIPLYPAMADRTGNPVTLGYLHAALAIGAFVASLTSRWTENIRAHGKAIGLAAIAWCFFLSLVGFTSSSFALTLGFIMCAGFADMISAIFRVIVWNQNIPTEFRGRMAGIEMLSYMVGPLIGGTIVGWSAEHAGLNRSFLIGGCVGVIALASTVYLLPSFWKFKALVTKD